MDDKPRGKFVPIHIVLLCVLALAGSIVLLRVYVVRTVFIMSDSMAPTMYRGDRVLALTSFGAPRLKRGDVVWFKDPRGGEEDLVKRVIAFPGEMFEVRDGRVAIDGKLLDEPYIAGPLNLPIMPQPFKVPDGKVMVLGDNRNFSDDSLIWGPLPISYIKGRISRVLWPPERVRGL